MAFLNAIELGIAGTITKKRNTVWLDPLSSCYARSRPQIKPSFDAVGQLNKYILAFLGLSIVSFFAIARKISK